MQNCVVSIIKYDAQFSCIIIILIVPFSFYLIRKEYFSKAECLNNSVSSGEKPALLLEYVYPAVYEHSR